MNTSAVTSISPRAFRQLQSLLQRESGILLPEAKRGMVTSRLGRRVRQLGLPDFDAYCDLVARDTGGAECAQLVDLLTTHETYFFREPAHFRHLIAEVLPGCARAPRVWCAAAASGEEAYSIAMALADAHGMQGWSVLGTDISGPMLAQAARGLYAMDRLQNMPPDMLKRYCLRGTDAYAGSMLVAKPLRERVRFERHNLLEPALALGCFDVIFLRNVLIYFDEAQKRRILANVLAALRPGGWLYTGHAESLFGLGLDLDAVAPSVHRKRRPA